MDSDGTAATNDDNFQTNNDDTNPEAAMKDGERLPQDNAPPFSPPEGVQDHVGPTFPATDSNMSDQEHYDAGAEAAAGVDLPSQTKTNDYNPFSPSADEGNQVEGMPAEDDSLDADNSS